MYPISTPLSNIHTYAYMQWPYQHHDTSISRTMILDLTCCFRMSDHMISMMSEWNRRHHDRYVPYIDTTFKHSHICVYAVTISTPRHLNLTNHDPRPHLLLQDVRSYGINDVWMKQMTPWSLCTLYRHHYLTFTHMRICSDHTNTTTPQSHEPWS